MLEYGGGDATANQMDTITFLTERGMEKPVSKDGVPGTLGSWASSFWTLGSCLKNGNNSTFSYLLVWLL